MKRLGTVSALGVFVTVLVTATPAASQQEIRTCAEALNYCLESVRRRGGTDTGCQSANRECLKTGSWSRQAPYITNRSQVPYTPPSRQLPLERR
jgi:hypothetical protein